MVLSIAIAIALIHHLRSHARWILATTVLASVLAVSSLRAQTCPTATPLIDGVATTAPFATSWYSFEATEPQWTAVALRSYPCGDWDLYAYDPRNFGPPPTCFGSPVAGSLRGAPLTDVIAGNIGPGGLPSATYVVESRPYESGCGPTIEWQRTPEPLAVDATPLERAVDPGNVFDLFAVDLVAGTTYTVHLEWSVSSGAGTPYGLTCFVFAPPATPRFVGASEVFEAQYPRLYTAPVTGRYALAVAHQEPFTGWYRLAVSTCPYTLAVAPADVNTSDVRYALESSPGSWRAVAFRGGRYDLSVYRDPPGGTPGGCFNTLLAQDSADLLAAALLVGQGQPDSARSRYSYVHAERQTGPASGRIEPRYHPSDSVVVNGPTVSGALAAGDVVDVYLARLEAGRTYDLAFQSSLGSGLRALVFAPPPGGAGWMPRDQSVVDADASTSFTATTSGQHLMVVLNELAMNASYQVGLTSPPVSVSDAGAVARARLSGIRPNPAQGSVSIAFELPAAGAVSFSLLDAAGRLAARVPARRFEPGTHTSSLERPAGTRRATGVYVLRMEVDGRAVDRAKIVLLPADR